MRSHRDQFGFLFFGVVKKRKEEGEQNVVDAITDKRRIILLHWLTKGRRKLAPIH